MDGIFTPGNIVVAIIVIAALVIGGKRIAGGLSGKESCCGSHEGAAKAARVVVEDTDEANYPYALDLPIGGMSCEDCAKNVEGALNGIDGTWATVDLAVGMAHVRAKQPIDEAACEAAVKAAGYYVQKL